MNQIPKIQASVFGVAVIAIVAVEFYDRSAKAKHHAKMKSYDEMRRMIREERDPCRDLDSRIASRSFWNIVVHNLD